MKIHRIIGPPGTGKTSTIAELIKNMDDISGVVALSFTRAAKWSLLRKARRLDRSQVSTIHSMAYQALGLHRENLLLEGQVASWWRRQGLPYAVGVEGALQLDNALPGNRAHAIISRAIHVSMDYPGETQWDKIRAALIDHDPRDFGLAVTGRALVAIAERWREYQYNNKSWDYDGLLSLALERGGLDLYGDTLILDEAQDLTPIMGALLLPEWSKFEDVHVLGDDDQAIYSFAGSSPELLQLLTPHESRVLSHSWRLPSAVHDISQRLIRQIPDRIDKEFSPRAGDAGEVQWWPTPEAAITDTAQHDGDTLVLARTRHRMRQLGAILTAAGIEHTQLGTEPKKPSGTVQSILDTRHTCRHGRGEDMISATDWARTLKQIKPSAIAGLPPKSTMLRWVQHTPRTLDSIRLEDHGEDAIERLGLIPVSEYRNARALRPWAPIWLGGGQLPLPRVQLGTIHQCKGLEADCVILDTETSRRIDDILETPDEIRVWYVAMTRARKQLRLCGDGNKLLNKLRK